MVTGQTFTGLSRGLQVWQDADIDVGLVSPVGATVTVSVSAVPTGTYLGGPISSVTPSSGIVVVFPASTDYTVV